MRQASASASPCIRCGIALPPISIRTDIRLIQAVLGHAHLDTTARYTRVATGRIAVIASPLSGKQKRPKKPRKNDKAA